MTEFGKKVREAAQELEHTFGPAPETLVVLGSGLGAFAEGLKEAKFVPSSDIPHWPASTAPGHKGRLVWGLCGEKTVMVMQGRVHYYETGDMQKVTFPIYALCTWGIKNLLLTNAAGAVDLSLSPGDLVAIEDHINFMGINPLIHTRTGEERFRFPDMTTTYSPKLLALMERSAQSLGLNLRRGVYMAFSGPSYETPAEIRMARTLGAHMVGMSTVPEAIVARTFGVQIGCVSCASNMAVGITGNLLTEEEVLTTMAATASRLNALLTSVVGQL